ncbi:pyrroline-5-carboxylate reductase [Gloeomargarita lithophora Alchichica-D10]|uniref:Pyrroline-5-carboxylate reductase n=1 Tax=Gloeomargarita lithophora Alchichica-D10 TaxID=1188229 RepID=A0A1J0ABU1_9CYAN|nr:pyrroline-5-carboxylate reductase [Gloeomargarita lithophora]APB33400.1 pyrroline-5-carboxylate reductase [Gloeomargarita lithophora Alchichica-D10]
MTYRLGVIGGGRMGSALVAGLLAEKIYTPAEIIISHPRPERRQFWADTYGVGVSGDNPTAAAASQVVLVAVKPQQFAQVGLDLQGSNPGAVYISVLAGTTLATLETAVPGRPWVRAMPNTPVQVRSGMTALAWGGQVSEPQQQWAVQLFKAVGQVVCVPETYLNGVTALAGSGPGYVALLVEALIDGGVLVGLPRALATQLALQTILGTAQLLQQQSLSPAELKAQVMSPGGTTSAGLLCLERQGVRGALMQAVQSAYQRAQTLG